MNLPKGNQDIEALLSRGWVSLNQFAKLVGISYPTAMRYKNQGFVDAIRVGGNWRIYSDEVRRFLSEGNVDKSGEAGGANPPAEPNS